jgi:hypothetical protein
MRKLPDGFKAVLSEAEASACWFQNTDPIAFAIAKRLGVDESKIWTEGRRLFVGHKPYRLTKSICAFLSRFYEGYFDDDKVVFNLRSA